ncbi:MFS transporter [Kribbella sp. NBC_00709]|uniref:MFS transporter n=1 Tax=Kribbella sp. NBC_00709 TaxID=2975972 RepID=UPI002E28AF32|nr:MFS transporter [Kribbella sp. NBC_00709]
MPTDDVRSDIRRLSWARLQHLLPPPGLPRALCLQTLLWSLGAGTFLAGNVVFFTAYVGLAPDQVAVGLSLATACGMLASLPVGRLVDRHGSKRSWSIAAGFEAAVYLSYPFVQSFVLYVVAMSILALAGTAGGAARSRYSYNSLEGDTRVRTLAFVRTASNIGFAAGGGVSGLVLLSPGHGLLILLPLVTGALLVANAVLIRKLPNNDRDGDGKKLGERGYAFRVLRDRGFAFAAVVNAVIGTLTALLTVVLPLWIIDKTSAPRALVAALFVVNTAVVVILQVRVSRGADTPQGGVRLLVRSGLVVAGACVLMIGSTNASVPVIVGVLVTAYLLVTVGELWQSAAEWSLFGALSEASRRAEYQALWGLGAQGARLLAVSGYTLAVVRGGRLGWLGIGVAFAVFSLMATGINKRLNHSE